MEKLDFLSIGRIASDSVPVPATDDWLPFQYEMDPGYNGAAMASLSFVARRGKSPQGDFAIDDLTWFQALFREIRIRDIRKNWRIPYTERDSHIFCAAYPRCTK